MFNETDVGIVGADVDDSAREEGVFRARTIGVVGHARFEPGGGYLVRVEG